MDLKVRLENLENNHLVEWTLDVVFFNRIVCYLNNLFLDQCKYKLDWLREQKIKDLSDIETF